jgi:phage terminase large subunit GpA-like protein
MLFGHLLTSIEQKFCRDDGKAYGSLGAWAEKTPVMLDGRPFSFHKHEYLMTPYADNHPHMVEIKAAQMGLTTKAVLRAMYAARYRNFRGILYLFPSRTDVTEFAKGRIDPLMEDNPDTLGRWLQETDSANIKQIWNCFLYLRGMKSRVGLKSIPVDFLIFDEMDEASPAAADMAMERMSHSEFREVLKLSNPTLPDYGIDKAFQETDQRFWHVKCETCGGYTCLEETFPDCLLEIGGSVIRACQKCEAEVNPSIGEWVAKHPGVTEKRGYHFSQLFSHYVDPAEILH